MKRERLQQQAAAWRKSAAPSIVILSAPPFLWGRSEHFKIKNFSTCQRSAGDVTGLFQRAADHCVVSLFRRVVDWSELEDGGETGVGRSCTTCLTRLELS